MTVAVTYPGVYIQEIPSGIRTITGVATSITAFIGRCPTGPTDRAETIFSFGDFQQRYGGLSYSYPLTYAVQDFFMNGGTQAIICRLYEPAGSWNEPQGIPFDSTTAAPEIPIGVAHVRLIGPPTPSSWVVAQTLNASSTKLPVAGGTTPPTRGQQFQLAGDTAHAYTVQAFDPVSSSVLVSPALAQATVSTALTFSPTPAGWTVAQPATKFATSIVITGGSVLPGTGQPFTIGTDATPYTVQAFDPQSNTLTIAPPLAVAVTNEALTFQPPTAPTLLPAGLKAKATATKGLNQLTVQDLPAGVTAPTAGQQFMIGSDPTVYTVHAFSGDTLTVYPDLVEDVTVADQNDAPALTFVPAGLTLVAASPGAWGNHLNAEVDRRGLAGNLGQLAAASYAQYGLTAADLFNLTVSCVQPDGIPVVERFTNVTVKSGGAADKAPNRLDRVLKSQSNLVRIPATALDPNSSPFLPATAPADGFVSTSAVGGDDGQPLSIMTYLGNQDAKTGMYMLEGVDLFNLMCIPADTRVPPYDVDTFVLQQAAAYCTQRRAMLIIDPPTNWANMAAQGNLSSIDPSTLGITGQINGTDTARNAAVYFPRVIKEDPVMNGHKDVFGACGIIAGVMASTDAARGVWKAPAGIDAGVAGIHSLQVKLTDPQNGELNPLGINCLRTFPIIGPVVWGARTLRGADVLEDDYKYVPVRRLTLFIEETLYRGTKWAVFEPNDETLWSSLRLAVNDFLSDLSRQGAFYGFNVTCDNTTTTQRDIDLGVVNILVQIAPVYPAEFVVIQIQQIAGQQQS
jgi:uncharacterized protein